MGKFYVSALVASGLRVDVKLLKIPKYQKLLTLCSRLVVSVKVVVTTLRTSEYSSGLTFRFRHAQDACPPSPNTQARRPPRFVSRCSSSKVGVRKHLLKL